MARFFNVDPLSEDYAYQSHYNFSENRVVDGRELEGLEWQSTKRAQDLPGDPAEFAEMIGGGINSLRAAVANNVVRTANFFSNDAVRNKLVVGEDGGLTLLTGVPKESFKEKVANGALDWGTIALSIGGGPEGVLMGKGGKAPAIKAIEEVKDAAKYSHLLDHKSVGPGKPFTRTQKRNILAENMKRNGGVIRSDKSGEILDMPKQSRKGEKANMNQAEIDHIKAKSKGGANSYKNAQVLSKTENLDKLDK